MKEKIEEIRKRWRAEELVAEWCQLPQERREKVIAEYEETSRELSHQFPEGARDMHIALDALEAVVQLENIRISQRAIEDVRVLLSELEKYNR